MFFPIVDPFLMFVFWSGVACFILIALITIQIVYLRLSRLQRERNERAFLARWRPLLQQAMVDPTLELPALDRSESVFFLKLWNHLHENLSSDSTSALNQIGARLGCYKIAHNMLRGGGRAKHLLAILTLGQLRDRAAWHDLMAEAVFVDSAASLNALRALAQIDADAVMREMTPQLLAREDWPAGRLIAIFQESPPHFHAPLLNAAAQGPLKQQLKALRMVEGMHLSLPLPVLAHLLDEGMAPELIVAALRVTLYPQLLVVVRTHLTHTDWRVRVQAVKALGRIGRASDVSLLSTLLDDSEWWVRYRTAQALADIPSFNRNMLDHLLSLTDDRYAHDILNQVMAERGIA